MQLIAKELLASVTDQLIKNRQKLKSRPAIAIVWVGNDPQTAKFIRAKQNFATKLDCQFYLHHYDDATEQQLEALIATLNQKTDVDGIVLQLPLPKHINTDKMIAKILPKKDIDNLQNDPNRSWPTPKAILELLRVNEVSIPGRKTVIIGDGRLVGRPLALIFTRNNWPFVQVKEKAEDQVDKIRAAILIISTTGKNNLIAQEMVTNQTVLVDSSGIDVDVDKIEPLVALITPKTGAIGPLTVCYLFENLLKVCS